MSGLDQTDTKILEINLISAQNLKPPSTTVRRIQTYAVVWIEPNTKLRTRIDRVGGDNPTWNDKFLFKVSPKFLSGETSAVSVQIFAVGYLRDPLIGGVRFLLSNLPLISPSADTAVRTPSFIALQIRRPSGRFQGVLNIGAGVTEGSDLAALKGVAAIGYRDLMGERRRRRELKKSVSVSGGEDGFGENLCGGCGDDSSDGADSTCSSSSSNASTVLKDWNAVRDLAGNNLIRSQSDGGGLFCGLLAQRRLTLCLSDLTVQMSRGSHKEN